MEDTVNKLVITPEAVYDYESDFGTGLMPKYDIKAEVELYITNMQSCGRLIFDRYFHVKYLDERTDKELMLFVYMGERIRTMQLWDLKGICESCAWTEELEDDGAIRNWLNTKFDEGDKTDWVLDYRLYQTKQKKLQELANNENYGEDYNKMVKELLKNYKLNKARIAVGSKDDVELIGLIDKLNFLDKCIDTLDDEAMELINIIYIQGVSLRKAGIKLGYCKTGLAYKRDRAIALLDMLFKERYAQ